ncbi:hypothetical protein V8C35DRAFT_316310 [Trichoderma chlorosporum]
MWLMQAFWFVGLILFFRWGIPVLCDIAISLLSNKKNRDEDVKRLISILSLSRALLLGEMTLWHDKGEPSDIHM